MSYTIHGKTALVTGANRGLGKAFVEALLRQGARRIYAAARELESLEPIVSLAPDIILPVRLDVTRAWDIADLVRQVEQLDILINNAGIATGSTFSETSSLSIAHNEMLTNYFGPVNLTHALLPVLGKSAAAAVINISSIAGISSFPILGPYSASKAALHSFTQGLRADKRNIAVLGVYPGPMDTRMAEGFELDKAAPAEVVNRIFSALENGEEDVFPDAFSQAMYEVFCNSPKALEQEFGAMAG